MKIAFGDNTATAPTYAVDGKIKWNQCAHHPDLGLAAKLKGSDGKDVFVLTGPAVAHPESIAKALGDKLKPGHVAVAVPQDLFTALPLSDH